MNINTLVQLTITISDRVAQGIDLGIPLLMGYHTAWPSLVRAYADHEEMLDDGFTTSHYLYKMARALKSQENAPPTFKIGRRRSALVQTIQLIPTVTTEGYVYKGTINETAFEVTVGASATVATVCDDFVTELTPIADCTVTDNTTHVTVATTSGLWLDIDAGDGVNVLDVTPDTTTDDDLAACMDEDDDFYSYMQEASSPASIALVAAGIEAVRKVAFVQSPDWNIGDVGTTNDIASTLKNSGYNRTFGLFHKKIGGVEWAAAAWAAGRMTAKPGSETWAFKTLAGIGADRLKTAQETAIVAKDWNHYTATAKLNLTFDGSAGGGRYGDITRFVDWLYSDIQTGVVTALANNPKIGYDDEGGAAIQSVVDGSLLRGAEAKGLRRGTTKTTVPRVGDVPKSIRATRIFPDVNFYGELGGAFHGVQMSGVLTP